MRFISVTKPGIIFGNIITVSGGYLLGSHDHFNFWRFIATLLGMCFIIASGCVFNNYIDRDIDSLMERTKERVLVKGLIPGKVALLYATCLGIVGFLILALFTNLLTVLIAFIGIFVYVVIYSLMLKRKSTYGTLIGGIAGSVPPVAGYCAATNRFDIGAILLFLILFFWQMPHFYAISIYRIKDFTAAAIPVLPIKKNMHYTKISMLVYIAAFTVAAIAPTLFGYTGYIYLVAALAMGLIWFFMGLQGLRVPDDRKWSRKMFAFSIINITLLCFMMAV